MLKGELVETITKDGLELKGFFSVRKSDIVVFHSHGTAGDFYSHKFIDVEGEFLSNKNISFLTANNRGHDVYADIRKHNGRSVEWTTIGGGFEKFEDCVLDISAWLDYLEKRGIRKVILQGHSLSQKALYYFDKTNDKRVVGIIQLSPQNDAGLMFYSLGEKKYKEINKKIEEMVKEGKGNEVLPKELSPVSYVTSAQMYKGYLTETGAGTLTPYHNENSPKWKTIERIKIPMLVTFGSKDVYMKPSATEAAKIIIKKNKNIDVQVIENASHSYIGYEKELTGIIYRWISKYY